MRVMSKAEILALDTPVLIREWSPCAYNDQGWMLTCGKDATGHTFGAIDIDPNEMGQKEEIKETWDWDGPLDLEDDKTYVVAEQREIALMIARLRLAVKNCDFTEIAKAGKEMVTYGA